MAEGEKPDQPAITPDELGQAALEAATGAVRNLGDMAASARVGDAQPLPLPSFTPVLTPAQSRAIDLLADVNLNVKIELGRTRMLVEDVLKLSEGAVVELDKLAGDPVDVFVNERHVARGEVLVLNDNFCVRINEILSPTLEVAAAKAGGAPSVPAGGKA
jgi:flagellar motor switch protein FliN